MIMLTLLILSITVHASSLPFVEMGTTEKSPHSTRPTINPNNFNIIKPTLPSSANGSNSIQHPSKPDNDENLLSITLDMNDDVREVVDQDMGKYLNILSVAARPFPAKTDTLGAIKCMFNFIALQFVVAEQKCD